MYIVVLISELYVHCICISIWISADTIFAVNFLIGITFICNTIFDSASVSNVPYQSVSLFILHESISIILCKFLDSIVVFVRPEIYMK